MRTEKCSICLETNLPTKPISSTVDENNVKLSEKLGYIAPETEWLENYQICTSCIEQLFSACRFKALCLVVNEERKDIEFKALYKDFDDYDRLDDCDNTNGEASSDEEKYDEDKTQEKTRDDYFSCFNCGEKFSKKTDLIRHIASSHDVSKECSNGNENSGKYKTKEYNCFKCGRGYVFETSLNQHVTECDGIKRHVKSNAEHQCDSCKKYYTTGKILKAHKKRCERECRNKITDFQCINCNKYYISSKTLKDHYKRGCKKDKNDAVHVLFCKICDEYFKTAFLLKQHILSEHESSSYHCDICLVNFSTNEEYNSHKNSKHRPQKTLKKSRGRAARRKFTCEVCGQEFNLLKAIIEHCVQVHSMEQKVIKPYSCDKCNSRFRSSTNMINHRLYHDRKRINICNFCGKSFITKNDLTAHENLHFSCRNYKCDKCERAFKTSTNLRTHQLIVHTDPSLWKYVCRICSKRFPQKSNHDQHVRRHIGEKNFVCPLCKKPFASKSEMQQHVSFHSNIRAYKCEYCGKEYRKKHTYDVHLTKIHGVGNAKIPVREKNHACHICPSRFYDRSKLARHLCIHSGLKPFPCYACEKKFTDKSYLKHHLKIVHNIVEETKSDWLS